MILSDFINFFYEKVKAFEGFQSKPYICPAGVLTIGYGNTRLAGLLTSIDESDAERLLFNEFSDICLVLKSKISLFYSLPVGVRFALADFVFNIGFTKFFKSTLFNYFKIGKIDCCNITSLDLQLIEIELHKWTKCKGKELKGLVRRRSFECELLYIDVI